MAGVGLIFVSCILFIHLGLGEAICETLKIRFALLKCVKCLSFWAVLAYSLVFTSYSWESCIALSFSLSYLSLWIDLCLAKIARAYEELYDKQD